VRYKDPRDTYMLELKDYLPPDEKEKLLGPTRQATRYPVFKDVQKLWTFDYAAEEKKRLKALPMWIPPTSLAGQSGCGDGIDAYLKRVYQVWSRNTGMNEEIALRLLMHNEYSVEATLRQLEQSQQMGPSYFEIVTLINSMTHSDAKIEFLSFLIKIAE
jgi:hypothetical protein